MSGTAVIPNVARHRSTRLATLAVTLLIAVGLAACSTTTTDAINTTKQLGESGIIVHGLESTSKDDLKASVSVLSDRQLADVATTTAAIVWRTYPIRITRLAVRVQGPKAELAQTYDRQQLEASYGPRAARLDASVEDAAISAASGVLKVGALVLLAFLLLLVSVVVLVTRGRRSERSPDRAAS